MLSIHTLSIPWLRMDLKLCREFDAGPDLLEETKNTVADPRRKMKRIMRKTTRRFRVRALVETSSEFSLGDQKVGSTCPQYRGGARSADGVSERGAAKEGSDAHSETVQYLLLSHPLL